MEFLSNWPILAELALIILAIFWVVRRNKSKKLVILDIPLLLENKLNNQKDIIIFVKSKKSQINKRLKMNKNEYFKI